MPDVKHFDPDAVLETVVRLFWRQGVASTGIQDVVAASGLNRSSLYSTFGSKQELYAASLRRYLKQRSQPMFQRLAEDERGLPAVEEFFSGLITARCSGSTRDGAAWSPTHTRFLRTLTTRSPRCWTSTTKACGTPSTPLW